MHYERYNYRPHSFREEFATNNSLQIFTAPNMPMPMAMMGGGDGSPALMMRNNSEPDLRTSINEFMQSWNNGKRKATSIGTNHHHHHHQPTRLHLWPLNRHHKLHLPPDNNNQQQPMVDSHLSRATFRPLPMPQFRQQAKCIRSPFAPLPFDRPQGREQCRDDDLLPSCWFSIDSEDLNRLHYKLQRRISRRRSLNRANCPFGESNPRRAKILEKYQRLRGGIRRALSDHQISFMDPKRDVELEIQQQQRKAEWKGQHDKRVSFSAPSALPTKEEGSSGSGGGGGIEWPPLLRQLARNKSSVSLQLELPTSPKCTQPAKPILARKASRQGGSVGHLKPPSPSPLGAASANFRNRTGTIASTGHYTADEYAICPMDYATFRAWRRGSRLSIDVLNNTISVADFELARKSKRNQHGGGGRIGWGSWVGFLKRVLADCLQQRRAISDLACFQQAA